MSTSARVASPLLAALQERTGDAVHLSIFDDGDAVYIDKFESRQAIRACIRVGDRASACCTATGHAMLAYLDDHAIERACRDLQRHTDLTITTAEDMLNALDAVRRRGYALTRGAWRVGVGGVASPIRSPSGTVIAGGGGAGPAERMDDRSLDIATRAVPDCAASISRAAGFSTATRDRVA